MGIRLGATLVLGVHDLQTDDEHEITDPRLINNNWRSVMVQPLTVEQAKELYPEDGMGLLSAVDVLMWRNGLPRSEQRQPRPARELIYHDAAWGNPNIFGVKIESVRDDDMLNAFASLLPGFDAPGYKLIPSMSILEDKSDMARIIGQQGTSPEVIERWRSLGIESKLTLLKNEWNYKRFSTRIEFWALGAEHILRQVGFNVLASDLKLMLCWDWN